MAEATNLRIEYEPDAAPEDVGMLAKAAAAATPDMRTLLGAFVRDESEPDRISGGVFGWIDGSWLYVSTLWVDEKLRGSGVGSRLVRSIEEAARQRGIRRSFLGTADFQAPEFYKKLGYRVLAEFSFGQGDQYVLAQEPLIRRQSDGLYEVESPPSDSSTHQLEEALGAFNRQAVDDSPQPLGGVFARDAEGSIKGGVGLIRIAQVLLLTAYWVDPAYGAEAVSRLLEQCEVAAKHHGLSKVGIQTSQAELIRAARSQGYQTVVEMDDFPAGGSTCSLLKELLLF